MDRDEKIKNLSIRLAVLGAILILLVCFKQFIL